MSAVGSRFGGGVGAGVGVGVGVGSGAPWTSTVPDAEVGGSCGSPSSTVSVTVLDPGES